MLKMYAYCDDGGSVPIEDGEENSWFTGYKIIGINYGNNKIKQSKYISCYSFLPAGVGGGTQEIINRNTTGVAVTSDGTYVDTGVTATITPTSSSNKILVIPAMAFFTISTKLKS